MCTVGHVPTREQITETVKRYLDCVAEGDADGITALYSADAMVEDPVGGDVQIGHDAIRAFYGGIDGVRGDAELLTLRIVGHEAAFHFRLTTMLDGAEFQLAPIDLMVFDDEGRIRSMRAFWSPED